MNNLVITSLMGCCGPVYLPTNEEGKYKILELPSKLCFL